MAVRLKPVADQTIVITGASGGIGLTTARMAARRGARVVLVARSDEDLRQLESEIVGWGGEAVAVPADGADRAALDRVARVATHRFGGFDTWVNNAVYGTARGADDERRLFETDFWGVVYGSEVAVEHLRGRGGALVNIGSALAGRTAPLQAMDSAAKHAVAGFTDSLRTEVEKQGLPISLTLVRPSTVDTPLTRPARDDVDREPALPAPVYAPEDVARAVLHAASHPVRELPIGSRSRRKALLAQVAPRLAAASIESTRALSNPWVGRAVVAATGAALVGLVVSQGRGRA